MNEAMEQTILAKKGFVLVSRGKPLSDLSDVARKERDERVRELLQKVGMQSPKSNNPAQKFLQVEHD